MKKMLASDYDGTFLVNNEKIKENIEAVKRLRSNNDIFVIATGNNYEHFLNVIIENKIEYDYLILDQGSVIVNSNGEIISSWCIEKEIVEKISKELNDLDIYNSLKFYTVKSICNKNNLENITKISIKLKDFETAKKITKKLKTYYKDYINAYVMIFGDNYFIEIISNKTDKENAIRKIAQIEKIPDNLIYTIGNGYNDISMIQYFNGFCMEDSVPELLEICDNRVNSVKDLIDRLLFL